MLGPDESDILVAQRAAVVAVDHDGTIVFANAAALDLLAHERLVGKPLTTIIPPRLHDAHREGFTRYRDSGVSHLQGRPVRVPALRGDGTEYPIALALRFFSRPDGTKLAVATLTDHEDAPDGGLQRIEDRLRGESYERMG